LNCSDSTTKVNDCQETTYTVTTTRTRLTIGDLARAARRQGSGVFHNLEGIPGTQEVSTVTLRGGDLPPGVQAAMTAAAPVRGSAWTDSAGTRWRVTQTRAAKFPKYRPGSSPSIASVREEAGATPDGRCSRRHGESS
jgi:hypothetical protein